MCSDMKHQILRLRESLVTLGAGELLNPQVSFFYMCRQVSSLGKSLFTLRAAVGLLSCVDSIVSVQVTVVGEGFVTGGAVERLVSCVCPLVNL